MIAPVGLSLFLILAGNLVVLGPTAEGWPRAVANLAVAGLALVVGWRLGLTLRDLGLRPGTVHRGLLAGLLAGLVLGALGVVAVGLAAVVDILPRYDPVEGLSLGALLLAVVVVYPLVTVVPEELAFRGVLRGAWARAAGAHAALLVTSVAFALWHLAVVAATVDESELLEEPQLVLLGFGGSLLALFAAGLLLGWLRERTRHLVAPMLVHWLAVALPRVALWAAL
ncbi:MAG: CPBP family intramembrane metalloprotease [Dehalococcoidia bacterium]|nr:CPBP family intramembrane metalloprotease [Dehalococcoidia bacterium]